MSRSKGLLDLPNELLLMIKDAIDPADLLSNACFFLLCSQTQACYHGVPRKAWLYMLRASGLGCTPDEQREGVVWRNVALGCARHAWRCDYDGCGVAQIAYNSELMRKASEELRKCGWDFSTVIDYEDEAEESSYEDANLDCNAVFKSISFNDYYSYEFGAELRKQNDIGKIAFLNRRSVQLGQDAWDEEDLSYYHSIAMRSFAVIPPVSKVALLELEDIHGADDIVNWDGVTVHDVLETLGNSLHKGIETTTIIEYLSSVQDVPEDGVFPSSWSAYDGIRAVGNIGDWFKLVHWDGFTVFEADAWGAVSLSFWFKYKELPSSVDEHLKRYAKKPLTLP